MWLDVFEETTKPDMSPVLSSKSMGAEPIMSEWQSTALHPERA